MSLKLKIGVAAASLLTIAVTAQSAFAADAGAGGQASGPRPAGAYTVRCVVAVKQPPRAPVPHPRVSRSFCCPDVTVVSLAKPRQVRPAQARPAGQPYVVVVTACCAPAHLPVAGRLRTRPVLVAPKGHPFPRLVALAGCSARSMVFDAAAGGSVFTEVSGPRLAPHELIFFRGRIYQIASVWAKHFTLRFRGSPFRNLGPALHDARALLLTPLAFVYVTLPHHR